MNFAEGNQHLGTLVAGRYRIDRIVGQGSFAWVFHAISAEGQQVAVKILHSSEPTAGVRFAREIEVLRSLPRNASLVQYITHGTTHDGWPLLVIEFVDGITLKEGMDRCHRLEVPKAVAFLAELCVAFAGLHQLGVAHRDVKPENILLAREGGIKLIDFGLIRDAQGILQLLESEDPLEQRIFTHELDQHILVGTPEYMAPEQFSDATVEDLSKGRTDTWSDVFSLGVILFQLLSGQKPFPIQQIPGNTYHREMYRYVQWRIAQTDQDLPECPGIDGALDSILRKALRQDPRRRQPDARHLMEDLDRYLHTGEGIVETDEGHTHIVSLSNILPPPSSRPFQTRAQPTPAWTDQKTQHAQPMNTEPSTGPKPLRSYDDDAQAPLDRLKQRDLFAPKNQDEIDYQSSYAAVNKPRLVDEDSYPQGHTLVFFVDDSKMAKHNLFQEENSQVRAIRYSRASSPSALHFETSRPELEEAPRVKEFQRTPDIPSPPFLEQPMPTEISPHQEPFPEQSIEVQFSVETDPLLPVTDTTRIPMESKFNELKEDIESSRTVPVSPFEARPREGRSEHSLEHLTQRDQRVVTDEPLTWPDDDVFTSARDYSYTPLVSRPHPGQASADQPPHYEEIPSSIEVNIDEAFTDHPQPEKPQDEITRQVDVRQLVPPDQLIPDDYASEVIQLMQDEKTQRVDMTPFDTGEFEEIGDGEKE